MGPTGRQEVWRIEMGIGGAWPGILRGNPGWGLGAVRYGVVGWATLWPGPVGFGLARIDQARRGKCGVGFGKARAWLRHKRVWPGKYRRAMAR